ncbi:MAG: alpha/beta hydrolase-fold protein [Planctomycetaceae bacterium]
MSRHLKRDRIADLSTDASTMNSIAKRSAVGHIASVPSAYRYLRIFSAILLAAFLTGVVGNSSSCPAAQNKTGFVDHTYKDEEGSHNYVVYVPSNYDPQYRWPVMLFLHGAGERGNDGRLPISVGLGPIIAARKASFPFIVVFPQCEETEERILPAWNADRPDAQRALKILNAVERMYSVDTRREVLTGWSMGGYGVWSLAAADPQRWHAVVPLSGGGDSKTAASLKSVPIWAFHGNDDTVILAKNSREMIDAVAAAGGQPRYTEVTGIGHDVWKVAYAYPDLLKWMLDPNSVAAAPQTLAASDIRTLDTKSQSQTPFVPVIEVPNAIGVRLGNQALKAIADSVPRLVKPDTLTGAIDDISTSTTVQGRNFSIYFSDISYTAVLSRARVRAYGRDRINIQLGLENIDLTIGSTMVDGRAKEASAGPISIVIGHQRPVWLIFDVRPYVKNRKLRLELVSQQFSIPEDNWYVTNPEGVWTRGWGMTSDRVSNGLVDGLYSRKEELEEEVLTVVPTLIAELEQQLVFDDLSQLMDNVWPLPVYRPEVRLFPTDATCDEHGVSIMFGMAAADVTTDGKKHPLRMIDLNGPTAASLAQSQQLRFNMLPQALEPLTELLIDRKIARIHVQDIPHEPFSELSNYEQLVQAIPELSRYDSSVEIRSVLTLTKSLRVRMSDAATVEPPATTGSAATADAPGIGIQFEVPGLNWELSVRKGVDAPWEKVADCTFDLRQSTQLGLSQPNHQHRILKMAWSGTPIVTSTGRFAEGFASNNTELNVEMLTTRFQSGWESWTQAGPVSESAVPDIDLGYARLRLDRLDREGQLLSAEFVAPQTRVTNHSLVPLIYQVKNAYSDWGGPYTLAPGASHVYDGTTPLGYQSLTAEAGQRFTLPAGSHLEFFVKNSGEPPRLYLARDMAPQTADASTAK